MTNIEDELKRFYTENTPPIDPAEKRRVVEMMARESQKTSGVPASESISFRRFVLTQVRFIDPICWILQVALIACVLIVGDTYRMSEIQAPLVMTFAMLTVAIAIPSAFKSFESKTTELELACRFNSTQVLASRLIIFGLADVLWFSIVIAIMPSFAASDPFSIFLYASTPFFLLCALCFYLARIVSKHMTKATVAAAAVLVIVLWQSIDLFPHWYSELSWVTWLIALVLSIALAAFELRRLVDDMSFAIAPRCAHSVR